VLDRFASADVLILGKHNAMSKDQDLITFLLSKIRSRQQGVAVAFTDLPATPAVQTALDAFVSSDGDSASESALSDALAAAGVGPRSREEVLPVLRAQRGKGAAIAVGVPSGAQVPLDFFVTE
jgi:hypothetical protein